MAWHGMAWHDLFFFWPPRTSSIHTYGGSIFCCAYKETRRRLFLWVRNRAGEVYHPPLGVIMIKAMVLFLSFFGNGKLCYNSFFCTPRTGRSEPPRYRMGAPDFVAPRSYFLLQLGGACGRF